MSELSWKNEYSVNVKVLDEQHRQLFEIINLLNKIIYNEQDASQLAEVFARLREYVTVHFATEEQLMLQHGYPDYEEQKAEHAH